MKSEINQIANKLVKAYNTNTFINPIPVKYCKNINLANKVRKLCEDKVSDETIGIKAGGTGIQALKKLGQKEPFIAKIYKKRFLKSGQNVKIYKNTKPKSLKRIKSKGEVLAVLEINAGEANKHNIGYRSFINLEEFISSF